MSMCSVIPCLIGRVCLLWQVCSLGKTLLAFSLLHFVLQCQTYLLLQVSLDFLLLHSHPLWCKSHLFCVLVIGGLISLHRNINFSFFSISGWGLDLEYCDIECFALEINRDHSVVFEIVQKFQQYVNCELPDVQAGFRKGRGTRDQNASILWIIEKKQESSRKTSISDLLTMPKPLTVWITINCGKFQPLEKSVCRSGSNS